MQEERSLTETQVRCEPETAAEQAAATGAQAAEGSGSGPTAAPNTGEAAKSEREAAEGSGSGPAEATKTGEAARAEREAAAEEAPGALETDEGAAGSEESSQEYLRGLLERQRQALAAERSAFEREKLSALVERELRSRGLAEEFAGFLMGSDAEESLERVERFEHLFQQSLRRELEGRLRLVEPPREPKRSRGWSRETLRSMSPGEINRNWEEIARTLRK